MSVGSLLACAVVAAAFAGVAALGWWAGARWRRAHDAARYAQIDARRMHVRARIAQQVAASGALLGHTQVRGIAAMKDSLIALQRLREQGSGAHPDASQTVTVTLDYQFAIAALRDAGYTVSVAERTH